MPHSPITAHLDKPLDVEGDLSSELPFNPVFPVNKLANAVDLLLGEVFDLGIEVNAGLVQYPPA
jgi:hypothetical protein